MRRIGVQKEENRTDRIAPGFRFEQAFIEPNADRYIIRLTVNRKLHYLIVNSGESGTDAGVPGNVSDGDPLRSNEWECDNDGVCSQLLLAKALKMIKLSESKEDVRQTFGLSGKSRRRKASRNRRMGFKELT